MVEIDYKDLDHTGPNRVEDVEAGMEELGVPLVMTRAQYVHWAEKLGLHRVVNERNKRDTIIRGKLAREVTRHLNYHDLKEAKSDQV